MSVPTVRLVRSGLTISRIGLGLSRLHYLSEAGGERLVHAALELGITHFDAARLYGDGLAERVLGRATNGRPERVTIATKFGLEGSRAIERLGRSGFPLRVARTLLARAHLGRSAPPCFSPDRLARSLRRSLAALERKRVDILFFHEPPAQAAATADDLFEELERFKRAGTVGAIGVSAGAATVRAFVERYGAAIDVLQTPDSDWDAGLVPDITFGAIVGGQQRFGASGVEPERARERLRSALRRRPSGAVLVATTRIDHLAELAAAAEVA